MSSGLYPRLKQLLGDVRVAEERLRAGRGAWSRHHSPSRCPRECDAGCADDVFDVINQRVDFAGGELRLLGVCAKDGVGAPFVFGGLVRPDGGRWGARQ